MTEQIECAECGAHDWKRIQTGQFTETEYLAWHEPSSRYTVNWDGRMESDTETSAWVCWNCNAEAPERVQRRLDKIG